jgi:hypothetical protein
MAKDDDVLWLLTIVWLGRAVGGSAIRSHGCKCGRRRTGDRGRISVPIVCCDKEEEEKKEKKDGDGKERTGENGSKKKHKRTTARPL